MALVDILLASYNGGKYIEPQILSIVGQSYRDWRLVVHDDGSSDDTVAIVRRLAAIDSRIELIEDGVRCGGAAANFLHLTRLVEAKYVMFCDQDDIWFDNKVSIMLEAMQKHDSEAPTVVYANSYVWKPMEGITGLSTLTFPRDLRQFWFLNSGMQGCVAIFNNPMCDILSSWNASCAMHDHLLHLTGLTLGKVEYVDLPLMLYRNHDANVTGDTATKKTDVVKIAQNHALPVVDRAHYEAVLVFFEKYGDRFSALDKKITKRYIEMAKMGFFGRLCSVVTNRFQLFNSTIRLVIKIVLRPYTN